MAWWKCKGGFRGYINITSTANATVTATTGSNSYSAVCDASGAAQIKVKKKGTYTVSSTGTYRLAHATVSDRTPVTAQYKWQKWNSVYSYYQATQSYNLNETIWSDMPTYAYCNASGFTFNSSNGMYTCYGGNSASMSWNGYVMAQAGSYPYANKPQSGAASNVTSEIVLAQGSYPGVLYERGRVYVSKGTAVRYYSNGTYTKGSTQYDNSSSASLTGYPTNGRHSDGYWYIAI